MKVLVTGGAGFIGSHIVDALIKLGHDVYIIDNLSTGKQENVGKDATHFYLDINSPQVKEVFNLVKPDILFHLAAQVSISQSIKDPILDEEINIRGTINLLENCKLHNVGKIVYSSSAAVYGKPNENPIRECHPTDPMSFYGVSKLVPEYYIKTYSSLYGIKYNILRYSNVFGPRQDHLGEGGVISIFLNKILRKETPIIFGDGKQTRDFIYVQDVVNANIAAISNKKNGTYNISTNSFISLNELIMLLSKLNKTIINPMYDKGRSGDILHSCLDNSLAVSALNWRPMYSLEQALKETYEYYLGKGIFENAGLLE